MPELPKQQVGDPATTSEARFAVGTILYVTGGPDPCPPPYAFPAETPALVRITKIIPGGYEVEPVDGEAEHYRARRDRAGEPWRRRGKRKPWA